MNFTREPIIETIISAKEGHKLSLRSSKSRETEEYLVDAVEVVSFGGTFFYRHQEKPKAFFIPSSDYEITEVKEVKLVIKNPSVKDMIKIAGGKDANRPPRHHQPQEPILDSEDASSEKEAVQQATTPTKEKRDKKRHRNKRGRQTQTEEVKVATPVEGEPQVEIPVALFNHLLQPPENLISDSLKKYKRAEDVPVTPSLTESLVDSLDSSTHKVTLEPEVLPEAELHIPSSQALSAESPFASEVFEEPSIHSSLEGEFSIPIWDEDKR